MPRRQFQHYIPRFILRNFAYDDSRLWTHSHSNGLQRKQIDSVFGKRHLYSIKTVNETGRSVESFELSKFEQRIQKDPGPYDKNAIGRLEDTTAPIIQHLIEQVKRGCNPIIKNDDLWVLKQFLYLSFRRTPESQERIFGREIAERDERAFESIRKQVAGDPRFAFTSPEEMFQKFPFTRRIRDMARENSFARIAAGVDGQESTRDFCENTELNFLFCHNTARRFIIGSQGYAVVTSTSQESGFMRSTVFPISPEIAVLIVHNSQRGYKMIPIPPYRIHQTNVAIAEQSRMIAGNSKELVLKYKDFVR